MQKAGMAIRAADERDLSAINDIYNHEVVHSIATFDLDPMSMPDRIDWFRKFDEDNPLLVTEIGEAVAGYSYYHHFRARPGYRITRECSVYIRRDHRGRGVARALYTELLAIARSRRVHSLMAAIGGANPASERLHEAFGFRRVGRLTEAGEKFGALHDVHLWQLML